MRRGKLLLALQAVKRALAVGGADSPEAHTLALRFCKATLDQQVGPISCSRSSLVRYIMTHSIIMILGRHVL